MAELKEESRKAIKELVTILKDFEEDYAAHGLFCQVEVHANKIGEWVTTHSLLGHLVVLEALGGETETEVSKKEYQARAVERLEILVEYFREFKEGKRSALEFADAVTDNLKDFEQTYDKCHE